VRNDLFVVFSCGNGKVRYNLGEAPFQYAAPSADYKGFVDLDVRKEALDPGTAPQMGGYF